MKILVVSHTFLPAVGGAELGIHEVFQRLGRKHEVYILAPKMSKKHFRYWGVEDEAYRNSNYQIIRFFNLFRVPKKLYSFLGGIIPPFSLSMALATLRETKRIKPDIINFHFFVHTGLAVILVKIFTKVPVVLNLTGRKDVYKKMPIFWKLYFKLIRKFTDFTISVSRYCLDEEEKISIIPWGADIDKFSPEIGGENIRKKLNISKDDIVLFAVQRLSPEKRVDIIIEAMREIQKEFSNIKLIIGGKGPEEKHLKYLTEKLNLSEKIIFLSYIPELDLPSFFASSDIFVLHSTFETFGIVFPQAFAAGKVVLSVNNSAIPELITHRITGFLVEPLNSQALARGVITLIKDEELRRKLAQRAREKAVEIYNWDKITQRYETIFAKLIGG